MTAPDLRACSTTLVGDSIEDMLAVRRAGVHEVIWGHIGSIDYGLTEDLHLSLNHIVARLPNGGKARTCRTS